MTLITATVKKDSADSKVGIGLKAVNRSIFVSSVDDSGLFATTGIIKAGHRVLSINNQDVQGMSSKEAITLVKTAPSSLTVVVTDEVVTKPATPKKATAAAPREQAKTEFHPRGTLPGGQW